MQGMFSSIRSNCFSKTLSSIMAVVFSSSMIVNPAAVHAQTMAGLPQLGSMVVQSDKFAPASLRALQVRPNEPLVFDFIVDSGNSDLQGEALKKEIEKLTKYFLATITIPEKELWVNLSPYEQNRIIPQELGVTEMGRDLLEQDYLLKQLSASLVHPDSAMGKEFWGQIYAIASQELGTTEIPMDSFNKIWIMPDKATVYEVNNTAVLGASHLKVMMEEDYLALKEGGQGLLSDSNVDAAAVNKVSSDVMRSLVLPAIEKEVNEGKNFAALRQMYGAMILATWYKEALKDSLLAQVYANQKKVAGVDVADKDVREKVFAQYVESYKAGVFKMIREEADPMTGEVIPRKYFSGGVNATDLAQRVRQDLQKKPSLSQIPPDFAMTQEKLTQATVALGSLLVKPSVSTQQLASEMGFADKPLKDMPTVDLPKVAKFLEENNSRMRMLRSAAANKDSKALNDLFEAARVNLSGKKQDSPALFWVRAAQAPKPVNASTMTVREVQTQVSQYLPITIDEARKLKSMEAFSFDSLKASNRNADIWEAALKSGVLGVQYFVTNDKRTAENSHVAYMQELTDFVNKYNGYVQVLLSVEESPAVLGGDGTGMFSAMEAIASVFGDDFIKNVSLNIITDGGKKERGGNLSGSSEAGRMFTPYNLTYYERAFRVLGQTRLQHLNYGQGRIYWTASDGDYDIGELIVGGQPESKIINDGSWKAIIHGVEEEIFLRESQDEIFTAMDSVEKLYPGITEKILKENDKTSAALFEKDLRKLSLGAEGAFNLISQKKLDQLGENFADPQAGALKLFWEKPTPALILLLLRKFNTNKIIPNAFLIAYTTEAFMEQLNAVRLSTINGEPLRTDPGSYFEKVFQAQFNPGILSKLPSDAQDGYNRIMDVFKGKILVGGLGKIGRFDDRGKTIFLIGAFYEWLAAAKKEGRTGLLKSETGKVNIIGKVKIIVPEGSIAMLDNVTIENTSDKEVSLTLNGDSFIQNSRLVFTEDLTLNSAVIVKSDIGVKLNAGATAQNPALWGVIAKPGMKTRDIKPDGTWETIDEKGVDLQDDEVMVSMQTQSGIRYLNRTSKADYKGIKLSETGDLKKMSQTHPRFAGITGVSDAGNGDLELIKVPSWLNNEGEPVSIAPAKLDTDYWQMQLEGKQLMKAIAAGTSVLNEVPADQQDKAQRVTPGGIDLDAAMLNMNVERRGGQIHMNIDPAQVQALRAGNFPGFQPVIINIQSVTGLIPALSALSREMDVASLKR